MGAALSATATSAPQYLTLSYDDRSVLVLRPQSLAAARIKAVELFGLEVNSLSVRILTGGALELSDEVWDIVKAGDKLRVTVQEQRTDRKRAASAEADREGDQTKKAAYEEHRENSEAEVEGSLVASQPKKDVKGKGKATTDDDQRAEADRILDSLLASGSLKYDDTKKHLPGCHHYQSSLDGDFWSDNESAVIVQEHTTGRQFSFTLDLGTRIEGLMRVTEQKTGISRHEWTLIAGGTELDLERTYKRLSYYGVEAGDTIHLVHHAMGQWLPRGFYNVEATDEDTMLDVKKKLSLQVMTPITEFVLASDNDNIFADDLVLGSFTRYTISPALISVGLWDPQALQEYRVKKEQDEKARLKWLEEKMASAEVAQHARAELDNPSHSENLPVASTSALPYTDSSAYQAPNSVITQQQIIDSISQNSDNASAGPSTIADVPARVPVKVEIASAMVEGNAEASTSK